MHLLNELINNPHGVTEELVISIIMCVGRHYYMKDVNIFIAEPGNTKATLAISALARAMKEMNKAAIVRCVWRQGQANVVLGVLTPNVSEKDNVVSNCKQICKQDR